MISVCLATYNGAAYIAEQLQSIVSQLEPTDEVIVSDDHSTDATLSVVTDFAQGSPVPFTIVTNPNQGGYVSNFENALCLAHGDYIFLSDQDDVWLPGKVSRMTESLQSGYGLCVSNASITDGQLHVIEPDYFAARGVYRGLMGNIFKFGYLGSCMAFTRQVLDRSLPFPPCRRYCTHDNWLFLVAQLTSRVQILQEPLLLYRRHDHTSTTGALNAHKPFFFRVTYRLYLIWHLILRCLSH